MTAEGSKLYQLFSECFGVLVKRPELAASEEGISLQRMMATRIMDAAGWVEDRRAGKWSYYRIARNLRPYQETFLKALRQMREEREDFSHDEARAALRLETRRDGICCVGLVKITNS